MIKVFMEDGLYQVKAWHFCAGFVIKNNEVTMIAPILRRNIYYWCTKAVRVG